VNIQWPKEKEQRRLAAFSTKAEWCLLKEGRRVRCSTPLFGCKQYKGVDILIENMQAGFLDFL
jgi:hypothetical protein